MTRAVLVRRSRKAAAAVALAAACAMTGVAWTAPPAGADAPVATAAQVPGILHDQVLVMAARFQPEISQAQSTLSGDGARLAGARARQAADRARFVQAAALAAQAAQAVAGDETRLDGHVAAHQAATTAVTTDEARLEVIGVQMYTTPEVAVSDPGDPLTDAQDEAFAAEVVNIGTSDLIADLHAERAAATLAAGEVVADHRTLTTDRATLASLEELRADRSSVMAADAAAVATDAGLVSADRTALSTLTAARAAAIAAVAPPPGAPSDGSPTIVGASALDASQLIGWYGQSGYADLTSAPIGDLIGWYLSEGAAEGVRGDVAFAQAIVETAGFSSDDAVSINNYAGIGHCDSCDTGLPMGSPQLGVRAQIQLLHSFADAALTTATLAEPLASPALTPETQPDRGCCATWQSLTGKWATDPRYGHTIMSVYATMLAFALAQ